MGGGSGEDTSSTTSNKTAELLSEATQLLKSMRIQLKLKVMQLSSLDQAGDDLILWTAVPHMPYDQLMTKVSGDKQRPRQFSLQMGSQRCFA